MGCMNCMQPMLFRISGQTRLTGGFFLPNLAVSRVTGGIHAQPGAK